MKWNYLIFNLPAFNTMKTITDKNRCYAALNQTRLYTCCLIFMIVCLVAQSNANTIDFDSDPAFSTDNNVASADDMRTDDPVEPQKILLIKSQEDMSNDWNKSNFWSPKTTP